MTENKENPVDATVELISKINEASDRFARENDRREKLLIREEALESRRILGGKSDVQVQVQRPETAKEYAQRIITGRTQLKILVMLKTLD